MKTKTKLFVLFALLAFFALSMTACDDGTDQTPTPTPTPTPQPTLAPTVVTFVSMGTFPNGTILNFSPIATLPDGVTYVVTDDKSSPPRKSKDGFNGQINASEYDLSDTRVTFTQTFYLNDTISVGVRTVVIAVDDFPSSVFLDKISDSVTGSLTIQYP